MKTELERYVDYSELALIEITDDPINSIHDAIDSKNISELIVEHWITNDPEKAGKLLFELLDNLLDEITQIKSDQGE